MDSLDVVKEITNSSNLIITWSMSLMGGSLLAILSTSYVKPAGKWIKLIYLIYLPGWICLAKSINLGSLMSRRQIMAVMEPNHIPAILLKMNDEFSLQIDSFKNGLIFFWIVVGSFSVMVDI